MAGFLQLRGEEREAFNQSKFEYFRSFNSLVVIFSCLSSVFYFLSDCQLFGNVFAWETLLPRTFILLPMGIFLFINSRVKSYKVMVPLTYLIAHGIMWCTIWAIVYLPIKTHAQEGFIIMQMVFVVVGLAAPFKYSTVAHSLVMVNIAVSNAFIHYENVELMFSLGIPCMIGIIGTQYVMSSVYKDQYDTKNKLENLLMVDFLTQVFNRNVLSTLVEKDSKQFKTSLGTEVTLLIVDLDFFKKINDTFGHEAGDLVLKSVAKTIKESIRSSDILLRWGGEEFVVIMPHSPLMDSVKVAERIRANIESADNGVKPITISGGLSSYKGDYQNAIERADRALYRSKNSGRNQVNIWDPELDKENNANS